MPKCLEKVCLTKRHYYDFATETKGIYCSKHKKEDMIDVTSKPCIEDKCFIRPIYNFATETEGIYCKKENMIDIVNKNNLEKSCF